MPQVLDLPAVYGGPTDPMPVPSRRTAFIKGLDRVTSRWVNPRLGIPQNLGGGSGMSPCDCSQGQPYGYPPQQQPNPWNPQPQGPAPLGQPQRPMQPFEPMGMDPCGQTIEALRKVNLDPDALRDLLKPGGPCSAPKQRKRRKAKARKVARPRRKAKRIARSQRVKKRRAAKASGLPGKAVGTAYRRLKNGSCWSVASRRFVKKSLCS
jgi:hypothetical protein